MLDLSKIWPEWKIEKRIGRGAYGEVYKAVRNDYGIETYSAIKIMSIPADNCEVDELFYEGLTLDDAKVYLKSVVDECVTEIRLMESLKDNLNVVSIEDYKVIPKEDEIGWNIYIRMELLTPLNEFLCDKVLSEEEIIKLGVDICNVLVTCEKKGIIHRDIKPENIMVNSFGDFKLGDFGIARNFENMTFSLSRKGTMNYMSPEVANGSSDYDIRVDIYSLGLVLYKLLNGNKMPFLTSDKQLLSPGERKIATERRLKGEKLPSPSNASEKLAEIILKACEADPENRFKTPLEMKEALLSLTSNEKTETKPAENRKEEKSGLKKRDYILIFSAIILLCAIQTVFFFLNRNQLNKKQEETSTTLEVQKQETNTETSKETETKIIIDYNSNKEEIANAKERLKERKNADSSYLDSITLEKMLEEGSETYEIYLVAKELIEESEYERAGKFIAQVINDSDFCERYFCPTNLTVNKDSWVSYSRERLYSKSLAIQGINYTTVYYSTKTNWKYIEINIDGINYKGKYSYAYLTYDNKGTLCSTRYYHYLEEKEYTYLGYDDATDLGKAIVDGVDYINNEQYEEAVRALENYRETKYADELYKVALLEMMNDNRLNCSFENLYEIVKDDVFVSDFFSEEDIRYHVNGYEEHTFYRYSNKYNKYIEITMTYDEKANEIESMCFNNVYYYAEK